VIALRSAGPLDAGSVAWLHADSWRRHYRGAYSDSFLDGDVEAERRTVWAERLSGQSATRTVVAEDENGIAGFVHVVFDADEDWGSLVDNLHVRHDRQRGGIGRKLMTAAAKAVADEADRKAMFLWVLQQNTRAQEFYRAVGGACVEEAAVPPPGGVPGRLSGSPRCYRFAWRDVTPLLGG
jgi:ribosomal protein S18 acetylase RimI-like enzyme